MRYLETDISFFCASDLLLPSPMNFFRRKLLRSAEAFDRNSIAGFMDVSCNKTKSNSRFVKIKKSANRAVANFLLTNYKLKL
ncbi:Uncharacterised protein [Sphingobacterium spiritivorum]|uniref:Uncharacterized protein n=1 Tax=Sphingobacterium spiritivorum TaxID=258 RepID=A0A380CW03_SPHSI|nr:Uncharacterised protein [Sphingobacterium spiritivorum]